MPNCFVIMPVRTPTHAVAQYGDDRDHFLHVLEHLFAPAIANAGHEMVKPIMRGADLIQAEIIKNLEQADLVLCDMSLLNPNVFFELGIRTALDRPVALVKDVKTTTYPFDVSAINTHSYDGSLAPWKLVNEIEALKQHLRDTVERADGRNNLWKYFGLTQRAEPGEIQNPVEQRLDLLTQEVLAMRRGLRPTTRDAPVRPRPRVLETDPVENSRRVPEATPSAIDAMTSAALIVGAYGATIKLTSRGDEAVELEIAGGEATVPREAVGRIFDVFRDNDTDLRVVDISR